MSTSKLNNRVSQGAVKKFFYAVGRGKNTGIYDTWLECKAQVDKFPNAAHKKFICRYDAENFVNFWKNCSLPVVKIRELTISMDKPSKKKNNNIPYYFDKDKYVKVYTDGSGPNCKNHPKAGVGVWFAESHPLNLSKAFKGIPSSNLAEIKAAQTAIQLALKAGDKKTSDVYLGTQQGIDCIYTVFVTGIKRLKILTDSNYLLNSVTKWIYNWDKNGWKSKTGKPVKHKEEFEDLFREAKKIEVRWEKVVAHAGVKGNESAHRLARSASQESEEIEITEKNVK